MKKIIVILAIVLMITSCKKEHETTGVYITPARAKEIQYDVKFLFEKDGIKIYRFYNEGRYHYFTTNGETMTSQVSNKTSYEDNIQ
jgi:hypothetical protein